MKVVETPLRKLVPYVQNNQKHSEKQIERVAESITRFGFNQPIVVDENYSILVGHCRRLAAIKLGLEKVPVTMVKDLTEEQKRAYRIIDNKTADDAEFDLASLELELKALQDANFDLKTFGLNEFNFDFLKEEEEPPAAPAEENGVWAGIITLTIPADIIGHFEPRLDELLRDFDGIKKERKEKKGK